MDTNDRGSDSLSIGEAAEKTSVSRRTIRFYVQLGLVDPPVGRGRGSTYSDRHIQQILRVRRLQREGLALESIRELPEDATHSKEHRAAPVGAWLLRIPLASGIRLEVDAGAERPNPATIKALTEACLKILKPESEQNTSSGDSA